MIKNNSNVSLPLAIWLAADKYDHNSDPLTISATALIKPIKEIILGSRVVKEEIETDLTSRTASSIGTAIHDSIEDAVTNHRGAAMHELGYPDSVTETIRLNPTDQDLQEAYDNDQVITPIYMEQRVTRKIDNFTISGKYDIIFNGRLGDFKSTGTYAYVKQTGAKKFQLQGSIYRWLEPNKITEDSMDIHYIFTNWMAAQTSTDGYPHSPVMTQSMILLSMAETDLYIKTKLNQIVVLNDAPEEDIPPCNSADLWRDPPVYKYYKNPNKMNRSTKNFEFLADAHTRLSSDGNVGVVVTVNGQVKACRYCPALSICKQAAGYVMDGTLKL